MNRLILLVALVTALACSAAQAAPKIRVLYLDQSVGWRHAPVTRPKNSNGPTQSEIALAEIGEAVKLLPPELLGRHPGVDWRGWAGLRDLVSHQYFSLELPRLRPAVVDELPALLAAVEGELGGETRQA